MQKNSVTKNLKICRDLGFHSKASLKAFADRGYTYLLLLLFLLALDKTGLVILWRIILRRSFLVLFRAMTAKNVTKNTEMHLHKTRNTNIFLIRTIY